MIDAAQANFRLHVNYRLGCGRRHELPRTVASAGITRPLVVTDQGIAALPWFIKLAEKLAANMEVEFFSHVEPNPGLDNVLTGVERFRAHQPDGLVLIGGGSVMDAGKAIALAATHPAPLFEYEFARGTAHREIKAALIPPMVAVPTTSGSGSEMSAGAVVTDHDEGVKRTLLHPALTPVAVLADPEVTFGLPRALTAGTGMDALTHALEALCSPAYNPIADGVAMEAIRLIGDALPVACREPSNANARTDMMTAASMAAIAFNKGLGLVHAMAHPLGALTGTHHGLANAVLLPYVLQFNRPAIAAPMERLARHLGLDDPGHDAVVAWLRQLRADVGIPDRLADVEEAGDAGLIAELAPRAAEEKAYLATNPRPADEDDIRSVYQRAYAGDL